MAVFTIGGIFVRSYITIALSATRERTFRGKGERTISFFQVVEGKEDIPARERPRIRERERDPWAAVSNPNSAAAPIAGTEPCDYSTRHSH